MLRFGFRGLGSSSRVEAIAAARGHASNPVEQPVAFSWTPRKAKRVHVGMSQMIQTLLAGRFPISSSHSLCMPGSLGHPFLFSDPTISRGVLQPCLKVRSSHYL